jgi:hypothetical protein
MFVLKSHILFRHFFSDKFLNINNIYIYIYIIQMKKQKCNIITNVKFAYKTYSSY